jgi:hypothetical protein
MGMIMKQIDAMAVCSVLGRREDDRGRTTTERRQYKLHGSVMVVAGNRVTLAV